MRHEKINHYEARIMGILLKIGYTIVYSIVVLIIAIAMDIYR